ncbi:MAG: relaxase/mobilization nuclease domain-containing protein [Cytophagales bacterium]|nr:relaxase/mobilization nuclease domain-containing protein [Cytophagales bacterium]
MKLVCDANPRVKNRQFHAVISTKGQSYSPERLSQIAKQYLHDMGYGENPYLIYFHGDTQNNHVHMVSTRIDKNGNKVNDRYEKIRSQKVIQMILGQNVSHEVRPAFDRSMGFNFSTKAQMKLLLEQEGIIISEDKDTMKLIKYGMVLHFIDQEKIK